jgi:CheY-like chemotaxis protein
LHTAAAFVLRPLLQASLDADRATGSGGHCRILVVDDNPDALRSVEKLLGLFGFVAAAARSGVEALEKGSTFRPDVVLLDIGMPEMDGFETARAIRAQPWGERVRIIALTGWGQPEDIERTRQAGFAAHLLKPLDIQHLLRHLRSA